MASGIYLKILNIECVFILYLVGKPPMLQRNKSWLNRCFVSTLFLFPPFVRSFDRLLLCNCNVLQLGICLFVCVPRADHRPLLTAYNGNHPRHLHHHGIVNVQATLYIVIILLHTVSAVHYIYSQNWMPICNTLGVYSI